MPGLGALVLFDAAVHAFAATLQGVVVAEVGSDLPSSSHTAPVGRVTALSIIQLQFAYGVTGDGDLYPISEALERGKGRTEGLETLNQALMRGLPSGHRVFGGRAKLIASLPLLAFIKNVYLWNPPPIPSLRCRGVHPLSYMPGDGWGVHPWGGRRLPPGAASGQAIGLGGLPTDSRKGPPDRHPVCG